MAAMSNYLEQIILNHIFRDDTFSKPSVLAIALCTSAPTDADTGDLTGKEVVGSGYARKEFGPESDLWEISNATVSNISDINFSAATGDWSGPITHVAIIDNSSTGSGNLLFHGSLGTPKTVTNGDTIKFSAGNITIQIDD